MIIYIVIIMIQFKRLKTVCIKLLKIIYGVKIKIQIFILYNVFIVQDKDNIEDFFGIWMVVKIL